MTDAPNSSRWLKALARAGDAHHDHRPDEQFAAIIAAVDRQRARRTVGIAVGALGLAAAATLLVCTPRHVPATSAAHRPSSAAAALNGDTAAAQATQRKQSARARRPASTVPAQRTPQVDERPRTPEPDRVELPVAKNDEPGRRRRKVRVKAPGPPSAPPPVVVPPWRGFLDADDAPAALAAMDDASFEHFVATASARELLRIANAARARRLATKARATLLAIRERFAESDTAQQATFLLGRVEAELAQNPKRAAHWFSNYVQEYPRGPLVAQARGRLVAHYAESGPSDKARDAARDYLDHHAGGPYAGIASAVLE